MYMCVCMSVCVYMCLCMCTEVLWAYLCIVLDTLVLIPIFGKHHAYSQYTRMKFLKYCGRIFVLFDMVVLRPILIWY